MQIKLFIKDKILFILLNIIIATFSAFLLFMVQADMYFILFIPSTYLLGCLFILICEFVLKCNYYKKLFAALDNLNQKFLLSEIIDRPSFYEGALLYDVLKVTNKSMNDNIAKYSISSAEYREYIELWVHEIKTPIAGAKLMCENSNNTILLSSLDKVDKYVEQALFYSRSNNIEKDYLIKRVELSTLVNRILRKNARQIIESKISIETDSLNLTVFTDVKWTDFILEQLIDNSIKYNSTKIKIYGDGNQNSVSLFVCDNGIGINSKDLARVFDKGFTGENGRQFAKSTGIGLYLCKKLCIKLGLNIDVKSQKNIGSTVEIIFPKSNMYE